VLNSSRLVKAPDNPVPGQLPQTPDPVEIDGEQEYLVSKLLSSRLRYKKLQYQADWLGHDPDPTWYPASYFKNAPIRLKEFHDSYPEAPGPPSRLDQWIAAAADDQLAEEHTEDDLPVIGREGVKGTKRRRTNK